MPFWRHIPAEDGKTVTLIPVGQGQCRARRKDRRKRGMKRTIGIVGGGAAGMTAAILAARQGAGVTLLEGNDRLGKKLLSTGNGKCNLGNLEFGPDKYYTSSPELLAGYLEQFDTNDIIEYFEELGLLVKQKGGYLYPVCEQASAVLDVLRFEIGREERICVRTGCRIDGIEPGKRGICLKSGDEKLIFDRVILACGGRAAPKTGSDGSGYRLARQLGHRLVPVVPALVQLRCREDWYKSVAGVRAEAELVLFCGGKRLAAERGELQLTDYGISGIPVFQMSRTAAYILREDKEAEVLIDFLPDSEKEGFAEKMLRVRENVQQDGTVEEYFTGVLNKKLMTLFIRLAGLKSSEPAAGADVGKLLRVYELCREFRVRVKEPNSFDNAQVCAGGVPFDELTEQLESRKVPGVFFAGELLDVDGRCGGYNLQWAWCSGYLAGVSACRETI